MNDCTETVDRRRPSPRGRTTLVLAAGVAVCAALTLAAGRASAATFSESDDDGYVLPAGETVNDNLFAAGLKVTIDGTVDGDLFAAGQEVIINGTVTGNLFGAGSRVHLAKGGHVNGDMFAGGSEVSVAGQLDGDLRAGGMSIAGWFGSIARRAAGGAPPVSALTTTFTSPSSLPFNRTAPAPTSTSP